eukprot:XP_790559.2 PREDICTED: WD repeat domain phosphoinositide-interacting protein 4 [Strongylocentrotus purpuratus]
MATRGILSLRFNQDQGCFSCGTETGLLIYNADPLALKLRLDKEDVGSVCQVEMLHRTNLIAVVAGGATPKFAENTVLIWDNLKKKFILEFTFPALVLSVRLTRERLIVALRTKVYVYSFPDNPQKLMAIDTRSNPSVAICVDKEWIIGRKAATTAFTMSPTSSLLESRVAAAVPLPRGRSGMSAIALATTSSILEGTLIRVFDTYNKRLVIELRRGSDPATLYCINFSNDSAYLCASSDKGTVHIFALKDSSLNKRSSLAKVGLLGPYAESQWGLTNFTVPAECACICAFGPQSSVIAICIDGTFHKYVFTPEGGCNRQAYDEYLELGDDDEF